MKLETRLSLSHLNSFHKHLMKFSKEEDNHPEKLPKVNKVQLISVIVEEALSRHRHLVLENCSP